MTADTTVAMKVTNSKDEDRRAKVTYGNVNDSEIESVGDVYNGRRPEQDDGD